MECNLLREPYSQSGNKYDYFQFTHLKKNAIERNL